MFNALELFRRGISRRTVRRYKKVFDTEDGRKVLIDMYQRFHAFDGAYVPGDEDETKHRTGQASVPLLIGKMVGMNPNDLIDDLGEIIKTNRSPRSHRTQEER